MMCRLLDLPRSMFYDWTRRADELTATAARRRRLGVKVCEVFDEFLETYGCRRVTLVLNERGYPCCINTVAELMRTQGLVAVQPRAYRVTTIAGEHQRNARGPDRAGLHRADPRAAPRRRHHLPAHRRGVALPGHRDRPGHPDGGGLAMAEHMRTSLVTDALEMASLHGHVAAGRDLPLRPGLSGRIQLVVATPRSWRCAMG